MDTRCGIRERIWEASSTAYSLGASYILCIRKAGRSSGGVCSGMSREACLRNAETVMSGGVVCENVDVIKRTRGHCRYREAALTSGCSFLQPEFVVEEHAARSEG